MKTTKIIHATLLLAFLFIAACGNKGDLFLTEEQTAKDAPQAAKDSKKSIKVIDIKDR